MTTTVVVVVVEVVFFPYDVLYSTAPGTREGFHVVCHFLTLYHLLHGITRRVVYVIKRYNSQGYNSKDMLYEEIL